MKPIRSGLGRESGRAPEFEEGHSTTSGILLIDILSFAGCPNIERTRTNVAEALAAEGKTASVTHIEVDTPELAARHRFLGSPSVRVNGFDVEQTAEGRTTMD